MDDRLQPMSMTGLTFNIVDHEKFKQALQLLAESLFDKGATLFSADNLITWNRNLSFLRDPFYLEKIHDPTKSDIEKSLVWRSYILLYFAQIASRIEGDFLELGCHTGDTASDVIKKVDFAALGKEYYLYDLFEWNEGDEHTLLEAHKNPKMYEKTRDRFAAFPFVHVTKGRVPDTLEEKFPEKVAFAHIDMNHPVPEAGALEKILPRLSKGGIIVFDDYGWWWYSGQKMALDPIAEKYGLKILELPTGQALLLNP